MQAPAIIFIDEIDAVGGRRRITAGYDGRQTLNQLLAAMDGFDKDEGVVVIAATNTPDILDPALTRPGRFDTKVQVNPPDIKGRKQLFELYLSRVKTSDNLDVDLLARSTPGLTGADISTMVNSSALIAINRYVVMVL